jgi:voltage-gated potassium channel
MKERLRDLQKVFSVFRRRVYEIIEVADPDDLASQSYDKLMIVCVITSIIPLCFKETNLIFTSLEEVTVSAFVLDYILRWATADLKHPSWGMAAFLYYPATFFAMIDMLSILPSLHLISPGFKLFRLFRLNKAFTTLRLLRYSRSFNVILRVIKRQKQALLAVCYLAGGYIFVSALIMFSVEPDSFRNFFDAIYWAVVTLTTVGYGDIYPTSDTGRIVSMLSSFVGIAIVALPTGIITAGYMKELEWQGKEQEQEKKEN